MKHSIKLKYTVLVASLVAAFPGIALAQAADDKNVQRVVVTRKRPPRSRSCRARKSNKAAPRPWRKSWTT